MNQHTPMIDVAREMAAAPAGNTTHGTNGRGLGGENDMGHHLARVNSPADKYEGCYLARHGMSLIASFTSAILLLSLLAFLAGGGAQKIAGNVADAFAAESLNH